MPDFDEYGIPIKKKTQAPKEEFDEFGIKIKKKVIGETSTLPASNSQDGAAIPSPTPIPSPLEERPIDDYTDLKSSKKLFDRPTKQLPRTDMSGDMSITAWDEDPNDVAEKEKSKAAYDTKLTTLSTKYGVDKADLEKVADRLPDFGNIPTNPVNKDIAAWTKMYKNNPVLFERKIADVDNRVSITNAATQLMLDKIDPSDPNRDFKAQQLALGLTKEYNNANAVDDRDLNAVMNGTKEQLRIIDEVLTGKERDNAIANLQKSRAVSFTPNNADLMRLYESSDLKDNLTPSMFAALQQKKLFDPKGAEQTEKLIRFEITPEYETSMEVQEAGDTDRKPRIFEKESDATVKQRLGQQSKLKELSDMGRSNQYNFLKQQYDTAIENGDNDKAESARLTMNYMLNESKNDSGKYPLVKELEDDERVKELTQEAGYNPLEYGAYKFVKGVIGGAEGVETIARGITGNQDDAFNLEKVGEGRSAASAEYMPSTLKMQQEGMILDFDKKTKSELADIQKDEKLSDEERVKKIRTLAQDNGQWITNPDKGKTANMWSKATLYSAAGMMGDVGAYAAYSTGLGALGVGKMLAASAPLFTTAYNDSYNQAVSEGRSNPNEYAIVHAAIPALIGLVGQPLERIKAAMGTQTKLGKIIAGMSESEWNALAAKESGIIQKFKQIAGSTAKEAAVITSTWGAGMSVANDVADNAFFNANKSGKEIFDNAVDASKHAFLSSLGLLASGAIMTGLKSSTTNNPLTKASLWGLGEKADIQIQKLDDAAKEGTITTSQAEEYKGIVKEVSSLIDKVPKENDKGFITDEKRSDILYNMFLKNKAKESMGVSPSMDARAEEAMAKMDTANDLIIKPMTEKQLEAFAEKIEKDMAKKDDKGELVMSEQERIEARGQLAAVEDAISVNELNEKKGNPEEISQPIELNPEITTNETTNKGGVAEDMGAERQGDAVEPARQAENTTEGGTGLQEPISENGAAKKQEVKELDKLANNVPDSGKITEYMSKDTIEKYTGEKPTNDQSRGVQELEIALNHGEKIIEKAREIYGDDYAEKTLDYIDSSTAGVSNKALMYVSLENALGREKLTATPEKANEITKLQALVYEKSQAFARENSLALNYQKLRKIARLGYDIDKITNDFFSAEERLAKNDIEKAVQADADIINKEAELVEKGEVAEDVQKIIEEGVAKEVDKIYENLPSSLKSRADAAIKVLDKLQAKLRNKTYDATVGIPVAIIDAGITTIKHAIKAGVKVADAIEMGIAKIKEKYGKEWAKEDEFRKDMFAGFEEQKIGNPSVKKIVKEALIEKGFGREISFRGKKVKIIDWKKLAGAAGTVSKISENVADVLKDKNITGKEAEAMKDDFIKEYIDLRTSVIEKAQGELARRNNLPVTNEMKSAAKKLAELYTYGLFETKADEFENTVNKAFGAKVSQEGFEAAQKIAKGLQTIYSSEFKGVKITDVSAKAAINKLDDQLRILLRSEAKKQGNFASKATDIVRGYFDLQQTMVLNNMKQLVENPLSGLQQVAIDNINSIADGTITKDLSEQRRKMMKTVYKDMVLNGEIGYGKVESSFVNRGNLDDVVNKLSDKQLYHGIASVLTGKATLNAMDAMYKQALTETKFVGNLIKILTHDTNKNKMGKKEALQFVAEKLTGQTFKEAQVTAKEIIEKINKDTGEALMPETQESIDRFANDIVKASLEMGGKITTKQIEAAYNAAYKSAGLGLGHEANNFVSRGIGKITAELENKINEAQKEKEWTRSAGLKLTSVLFRNVLNPFVGGGTNWLVLKIEKTGFGLVTGLGYDIFSKKQLDLSTEVGQKRLEQRLYNQSRVKDQYMRGLVGGAASILTWAAFNGLAGTDDYRKWRAKNQWAARYLDIPTSEYLLAQMAIENSKSDKRQTVKYINSTLNKNDAFDATTKVIKSVGYMVEGDGDKAKGAFGEAVGSKFSLALPWRLVKDGHVIYQGVTGKDPYHGDYKPSEGFLNGVFQGGAIEWMGFRPGSTKPKGRTGGGGSSGRFNRR